MRRFFLALIAVVVWAVPQASWAAAYTFEQFSAAYTLEKSGAIFITEDFDVTFTEPRHGLLWHVPTRYATDRGDSRSIRLRVHSITDAEDRPVPYDVTYGWRQVELKIGDPDATVTGPTHYRIRWVLERAWNFFDDHDEFYWNVIGQDQEDMPARVTADVTPPDGVAIADVTSTCFAGPAGTTDTSRCSIAQSSDFLSFVSREPMTMVIGLPKGSITAPTLLDKVRWFVADNGVFALPVVVFFILLAVWFRHGRDPKGRGTIIPEYQPPNGLDPMMMGTLLSGTTKPVHVTAGIVDLAVRGYLTIEAVDEKKKQFVLVKQKDAGPELSATHRRVMDDLFANDPRLDLSKKPAALRRTYAWVGLQAQKDLTDQGYFTRHPGKVIGAFALTGFAVIAGTILVKMGMAWTIAGLLTGAEVFLFGFIMPKTTVKGALAVEAAKGFKLFLDTAERDRLKWQEQEGLFEKYLPYAMVFGVAKHWTNTFAGHFTENPSWYHGSSLMGATSLSDAMADFSTQLQVASSFSSGGSGFSGGSSGGGGGGGGGGSW